MGFVTLLGIGVGLSMDAFAASVCKGLGMKKVNYLHALVIALLFGGAQAVMPFVGWLLGSQFEGYIKSYDHWVTFVLLAIIGGKMILDAVREGDSCASVKGFDIKELLVLAVATSIDALAVGVSFAFNEVNIALAVSVIGVTTFLLCLMGVILGNNFGSRYKNRATMAGGIILILIGLKILLEHLGIISF